MSARVGRILVPAAYALTASAAAVAAAPDPAPILPIPPYTTQPPAIDAPSPAASPRPVEPPGAFAPLSTDPHAAPLPATQVAPEYRGLRGSRDAGAERRGTVQPAGRLDFTSLGPSNYNPVTGDLRASGGVEVRYNGAELLAERVEGNVNGELTFAGNARISSPGVDATADTIHYLPRYNAYRLENPHATLEPSLFSGRILDAVYVRGGRVNGLRSGQTLAEQIAATTCIYPRPHYELRIRSATLYPGKRLVLRRTAVYLFGQRLGTLPYIVVPLDRRGQRPRTDYLPELGVNRDEGYYARFPYVFAEGGDAATLVRIDTTQKRGIGYRVEQEYLAGKQPPRYEAGGQGSTPGESGDFVGAQGYGAAPRRLPRLGTGLGPLNGGLFAVQGYASDGVGKNFLASFRHQQSIGGSNRVGFTGELQRNSFYIGGGQSATAGAFTFAHADATHGVNADLTINLNDNRGPTFRSDQITAILRQAFTFASRGATRNSFTYDFNLSRFSNSNAGATVGAASTAELDTRFEFQHSSREYTLTAAANKNTSLGSASTGLNGSIERLPELRLSADTFNFRRGFLRRLPAHLDLGVARFSEPGKKLDNDRAVLGFALDDITVMKGRTEAVANFGFEQRLYSDGAAQFLARNRTRLRQHFAGRSGVDLTYTYEQPEGGTPFFFDRFGRSHNIAAEAGYLEDKRFQLALRTGYDFLGTSRAQPWQSVSARMMYRPVPNLRLDTMATYDPNRSRFFSVTSFLRYRAARDLAINLVTRYDPQQKKFSQINSQFDVPIGNSYRVTGLLRYNGLTQRFEQRNLQVTKDFDCMQASLTYSESPFGFRNERQLFFSIRLKAFPFFRSFAHGPAGEATGIGLGDIS